MRTKLFLSVLLFVFAFTGTTQIPPGYYDAAINHTGDLKREKLEQIIDGHTSVSYSDVWNRFQYTDDEGGSQVWDIYSDNPSGTDPYTYTLITDQCGNYSGEGDCYNREHTVPSSWFNSSMPMYTDLFHLFPTDGYVNGQRSSHPYGETNSPSFTSQNGSMVGNSSVSGYTGTVFEPIDEYKGDVARVYFYMATRYRSQLSSWTSDMFAGNNLTQWAVNMLITWHLNDPVSQKEIDRNEVIYNIQGNRNPYVDHPEWVQMVWWYMNGIQSESERVVSVWSSEGSVFVESEGEEYDLRVFDLTGKEVQSIDSSTDREHHLNLVKGVYIISVSTVDTSINKKVIIY